MTNVQGINRRAPLLGTAVVVSARGTSVAADFSYKFATNVPAALPLNICLQRAFDCIRQENGDVPGRWFSPKSHLAPDGGAPAQLCSDAAGILQL